MTVRAVLFDWGGVIQRTVSGAPRLALDAELGLPPGSVERAVFASAVWQQASTGRCDGDSAWEDIAAQLGWPAKRLDELVTRFFQGDVVDEELVALIRRLRRSGLKVGLLSNAPLPRERAGSAAAAGRWGMDGLFDAQVFSCEVGALKPDPRTYQAALAALAAAPGETVFIDDVLANVRGAHALGIDALLFGGVASLRRELAQRGLPVAEVEKPEMQ